MEVGNRVITLVPVHVDHNTVERANTRHALDTSSRPSPGFPATPEDACTRTNSTMSTQFNSYICECIRIPLGRRYHRTKQSEGWQLEQPGSAALRAVGPARGGPLADAVALVGHCHPPGLVQVGWSQEAVGEQEVRKVTGMTAFGPDEALEKLLVVRYRALPAQVQGDDHAHHRDCLRGGQAPDVLLVVVGHGQPGGRVPVEVAPDTGHRFLAGLAPPPQDRGPGGQLLAVVGGGRRGIRGRRRFQPQPQHPGTDAHPPSPLIERYGEGLVAGRGGRQHMLGRPPYGLYGEGCAGKLRRQVDPEGAVAAEQLPVPLDVPQARAPWRTVQGQVLVVAEQAPV